MTIASLKSRLPAFAKDVSLNLSSIGEDDSLTAQQKYGLMVACGHATRNPDVSQAMEAEAAPHLAPGRARRRASRRHDHGDEQHLLPLPAPRLERGIQVHAGAAPNERHRQAGRRQGRLRALVAGGLGDQRLRHVPIDSHEKVLREHGVPASAVQTAVRFAAVIQSAAVALEAAAIQVQHAAE